MYSSLRPHQLGVRAHSGGSCLNGRVRIMTPVHVISQRSSDAGVQHQIVDSAAAATRCPVLRLMNEIPEYKSRGLLDSLEFVAGDILHFQQKQLQGRPLVRGWSVGETLMVGDASIVRQVMSDDDCPLSRQKRALLGAEGILFLTGEKHARMRAFMSPSFAKDEIEKYTPKVQTLVSKYLDRLVDLSQGSKSTKAYTQLRLFTFEVICTVVAGLELSPSDLEHTLEDYQTFIMGMVTNSLPDYNFILDLPFLPRGRARSAKERISKKLDAIAEDTKRSLESGENVDGSGLLREFIAAGMETQQPLTRDQIIDNMFLFLLAGFDTTATLLTALVTNAYKYPTQWQAVVREQESVVAQYGTEMTPKVLRQMKATGNFVKETLRLKHPVPQTMRSTSKDMVLGDYLVTEGNRLYISLQYLAMSDPLWANETGDLAPDVFNPDRFVGVTAGMSQQMAFGHGKHSCLGQALAMMEAKVALAMLARGYDVKVLEEPRWLNVPFTQCINGLPVVARKRPAAASA